MKQITEDYVSYEIAKLLKEKGFNEDVTTFYNSNGKFEYCSFPLNHNLDIGSGFTSAPAQSLALKWLREVHNQNITVKAHNSVARLKTIYYAEVQNLLDLTEKGFSVNGCTFKDTYEEAVEAALKYTLENLI